jgi:hypothetical protein
MASELYQSFGTSANNAQVQQNPREQAIELMKQQGIQIPQGMENNPSAILNHLMQSGQIPQGRLNMAQQIMQRMFRR